MATGGSGLALAIGSPCFVLLDAIFESTSYSLRTGLLKEVIIVFVKWGSFQFLINEAWRSKDLGYILVQGIEPERLLLESFSVCMLPGLSKLQDNRSHLKDSDCSGWTLTEVTIPICLKSDWLSVIWWLSLALILHIALAGISRLNWLHSRKVDVRSVLRVILAFAMDCWEKRFNGAQRNVSQCFCKFGLMMSWMFLSVRRPTFGILTRSKPQSEMAGAWGWWHAPPWRRWWGLWSVQLTLYTILALKKLYSVKSKPDCPTKT